MGRRALAPGSSLLLLLLALLSLSSAVPSITYSDVSVGAYFWPSEPLLVTIHAQQFDLLVTNMLDGTLTVTLSGVTLDPIPSGATVYFEPNVAQGWIALNATFVLTDPASNATLGQTSVTLNSPPAWIANITVDGSPAQMGVTTQLMAPPLHCAFSDPMGISTFSALEPSGNQQTPGPQIFICPIEYFPDVIPVGTLFVFGVVLLPQVIPVSGPAVTFKTGAVWTQINSVSTVCSGGQLEVSVGGFFNVSEEYALQWQLHGATATLTGPWAKPKAEGALTLRTGSPVKSSATLLALVPRSTPSLQVPTSGVQIPYAVAAAAPCKNPNHGAAIALICLGVFAVLVMVFGAFFWYYRRFIGHDVREQASLLRGNTN